MPLNEQAQAVATTTLVGARDVVYRAHELMIEWVDFLSLALRDGGETLFGFVDSFKYYQLSEVSRDLEAKIIHALRDEDGLISPRLKRFFLRQSTPFQILNDEPHHAIQLKKFLNSLHALTHALRAMESIQLHRERVVPGETLSNTAYVRHVLHEIWVVLTDVLPHLTETLNLSAQCDLHLWEMFGEELSFLNRGLEHIGHFVKKEDKPQEAPSYLDEPDTVVKIGRGFGLAIEELNPKKRDTDFNLISEFAQYFSALLQQCKAKLDELTPEFSEDVVAFREGFQRDLKIDPVQLTEFGRYSQELMERLEAFFDRGLRGAGIMDLLTNPIKLYQMSQLVSPLLATTQSIIQQVGQTNSTLQETIKRQLYVLKFERILPIIIFVDKLEENLLLRPGVVSKPIMQALSEYYAKILDVVKLAVQFEDKDCFLTHFEDTHFIDKRADGLFKRSESLLSTSIACDELTAALERFFGGLSRAFHTTYYLIDLSPSDKAQLQADYVKLQKIVREIAPSFDKDITRALTGESIRGEFLLRYRLVAWAGASLSSSFPDRRHAQLTLHDILTLQPLVLQYIESTRATKQLLHQANLDIVSSVYRDSLSQFRPFSHLESDLFTIHEPHLLALEEQDFRVYGCRAEGHYVLVGQEGLTFLKTAQLSTLASFYSLQKEKMTFMYRGLQGLLMDVSAPIAADQVAHFRQQYVQIQKPFCHFMLYHDAHRAAPIAAPLWVDKCVVEALMSDNAVEALERAKPLLLMRFQAFDGFLRAHLERLEKRFGDIARHLQVALSTEGGSQALVYDERAYHRESFVVKHQMLTGLTDKLQKVVEGIPLWLSQTAREHLKIDGLAATWLTNMTARGLPFPEGENELQNLAQPSQTRWVKCIYNFVYHLHQMAVGVENLPVPNHLGRDALRDYQRQLERLSQEKAKGPMHYFSKMWCWSMTTLKQAAVAHEDIVNGMQVAAIYFHAKAAYNAIDAVSKDSFARGLLQSTLGDITVFRVMVHSLMPTFAPAPEEVIGPSSDVKSTPMWYAINNLMLVPELLDAYTYRGVSLPEHQVRAIQSRAKKLTLDLQGIIEGNASVFSRLLSIPHYLRLYSELRKRLIHFAESAHTATVAGVDEIRQGSFLPLLSLADEYELRFGLQPGMLSDPLDNLLTGFLKGMVKPLQFDAKHYIELVTDSTLLQSRMVKLELKRRENRHSCQGAEDQLRQIQAFLQIVERYRRCEEPGPLRDELVREYAAVLPLLRTFVAEFKEPVQKASFDTRLDILLNRSMTGSVVYFGHIRNLALTAEALLKGRLATKDYFDRYFDEKIAALHGLQRDRAMYREEFKVAVASELFDEALTNHLAESNPYPSVKSLYAAHLSAAVIVNKMGIITTMVDKVFSRHTNMEQVLKRRLELCLSAYGKQYNKAWRALNEVAGALDGLEHYLQNATTDSAAKLFESKETLSLKQAVVKRLRDVMTDETQTCPLVKVSQLKAIMQEPQTTRAMSRERRYKHVDFDWFKHLMYKILRALGLWKSPVATAEKAMMGALEGVQQTPQTALRQNGFFTPPDPEPSVSSPDATPPRAR